MTVELREHENGVLLPIQGQPKSRQNGIVGVHDGRLKVAVTEAPEKGKANAAIAKVLASELGLKKSQINLHRGATSSQKQFLISGISAARLRSLIADFDC
jgi:uncharacterized protein (TIGR00251 family)